MADIELPASSFPDSAGVLLIPLTNPHFPLRLDVVVFAGDHIGLSLKDAYGSQIWEEYIVPKGGGALLASLDLGDDDG